MQSTASTNKPVSMPPQTLELNAWPNILDALHIPLSGHLMPPPLMSDRLGTRVPFVPRPSSCQLTMACPLILHHQLGWPTFTLLLFLLWSFSVERRQSRMPHPLDPRPIPSLPSHKALRSLPQARILKQLLEKQKTNLIQTVRPASMTAFFIGHVPWSSMRTRRTWGMKTLQIATKQSSLSTK